MQVQKEFGTRCRMSLHILSSGLSKNRCRYSDRVSNSVPVGNLSDNRQRVCPECIPLHRLRAGDGLFPKVSLNTPGPLLLCLPRMCAWALGSRDPKSRGVPGGTYSRSHRIRIRSCTTQGLQVRYNAVDGHKSRHIVQPRSQRIDTSIFFLPPDPATCSHNATRSPTTVDCFCVNLRDAYGSSEDVHALGNSRIVTGFGHRTIRYSSRTARLQSGGTFCDRIGVNLSI
ncbi:hypothetical protein SODALDRAFT_57520 [Sodiomyces alkalinus F11]|uniref:Uncharacterized protein n=1 Tax=Sodiomyces alkalinus (strain CBS 110278 / VKM F-3762 / F11) TaxID=1314773 RepID=A0A3N2PNR1_SODAK|nr:hypothetical protein SODALDRAFT_57520 [Sodiomyces alkalinus F11]ROT36074.1 hypothetical protein SODALDRAFT_57520 [Sodiomyces alkalinus F11]